MREGFSRTVYGLLVLAFLVASGVTTFWLYLYVRDAWIGMEPLVAGRFD